MKSIFERVISEGNYDTTEMYNKIETAYISGKITEADRNDLVAQVQVNPKYTYDSQTEIIRLWAKIHELEALVKQETPSTTAPQVWVQPTGAHDGYHKGARVVFEGHTYESIYDGINVWSPTVYPLGWSKVI